MRCHHHFLLSCLTWIRLAFRLGVCLPQSRLSIAVQHPRAGADSVSIQATWFYGLFHDAATCRKGGMQLSSTVHLTSIANFSPDANVLMGMRGGDEVAWDAAL
jgi:hypothetical protein